MVFVFGNRASAEPTVDKQTLNAKMGPLTLENGFIRGALTKVGLLSAGKRGTRLRRRQTGNDDIRRHTEKLEW